MVHVCVLYNAIYSQESCIYPPLILVRHSPRARVTCNLGIDIVARCINLAHAIDAQLRGEYIPAPLSLSYSLVRRPSPHVGENNFTLSFTAPAIICFNVYT